VICTGEWNWLIGRRLSLGTVIDICNETATVRHGREETRMLLSELLEEDYKSQDRYMASMSEALNTGDGVYRP
jgi:hypothetical protein